MRRILAIVTKEFVQIFRDRRTLAIVIALPLIQIIMFGYAINTTTDHLPTVVFDEARDRSSRELVQAFNNSGYFDVLAAADSASSVRTAIDRGEAKVGLVIPPDFSENLTAGRSAQLQVVIDGSDPNIAQTATFAAGNVAQSKSLSLVSKGRAMVVPIDYRPNVLYNPGMLSVNFMVPGLVGMILQFQTLILTAFAVVRERERGTLEQLIVTPIKPLELLLGKLIPYTVIAFINIALILALAVYWFHVEIVGSLPLLLGLSMLFLASSLGIGLLLSTVSATQAQAVQMAIFIMLPSVLLSGFMFPRESMPQPLQDIGQLIPLTYFLKIIRGIVLKGIGFEELQGDILPLAVFGIGVFALAVNRFQKKIL